MGRYQITLSGLHASNTPEQAAEIMSRSISLAHSACTPSTSSSSAVPSSSGSTPSRSPGVVLSLGPFGAHLKPSQEYAGVYPPPYGPSPSGPSDLSTTTTTSDIKPNHFPTTPSGRSAEQAAELELALWHFQRLSAFLHSPSSAWDKLEWVAFETVPLLTEIRAVRRAMGVLNAELGEERRKKFWVASAFPNGLHPQTLAGLAEARGEEGEVLGHAGMEDLLAVALGPLEPLSNGDDALQGGGSAGAYADLRQRLAALQGGSVPPADAIGINCTSPAYLPALVRDMTAALNSSTPSNSRPSLVLYPDGGAVYDTTTKTWTNRTSGAKDWAVDVAKIAKDAAEARVGEANGGEVENGEYVWAGIIVGGCCKAGFEEIRLLRQQLKP